jgi:hypothetical protein
LSHALAGGLYHFKKVSHQVLFLDLSAVGVDFIELLYCSLLSFKLLRCSKGVEITGNQLRQGTSKCTGVAAVAAGYHCDGAVCSTGKTGVSQLIC